MTKKILRLTKKQLKEVQEFEIKPDSASVYLHCKDCLKDYQDGKFGKGKSPKEALTYGFGAVEINYDKDKKMGIMAVFCNRCGKPTWDSRHLTHLY